MNADFNYANSPSSPDVPPVPSVPIPLDLAGPPADAVTLGPDPLAAPQTQTETPPPQNQTQPPVSVSQALRDGWKNACADAKRAVETGMPKMKAVVAKAAYGASYVTAYGTMFGATFVKELLPEPMKKGFSAGAKKGSEDAEAVVSPAPDATVEAAGPSPQPA